MIQREKKVEDSGYKRGDPRGPLSNLDEGTQARVVGYLLAVKQEHGESCNCYLDVVDDPTDNHLVLVNPKVVTDFPLPAHATKSQLTAVFTKREPKSVTAEFTPRVRADGHPNFTSELQEMLNTTAQGASMTQSGTIRASKCFASVAAARKTVADANRAVEISRRVDRIACFHQFNPGSRSQADLAALAHCAARETSPGDDRDVRLVVSDPRRV